ncbi:MBL fold metallo-hydrolase [Thalassotalea sediminis]|uniref:MBL fold metallo-hydrolase n=1 Tax=Thalassotalea sediminis TaxID=1759089 RepID=UPI0025729301|nr:MBL fold metallo-hydrolase [Thalassotalea sediminis]
MAKFCVPLLTGYVLFILCFNTFAHDQTLILKSVESADLQEQTLTGNTKITYLGNEALLINASGQKILFDPFFSHDFGIYQLVPAPITQAILTNKAPFDDIDAIFISHAHRDHFSAEQVAKYLAMYPGVRLFASQQAISQINAVKLYSDDILPKQLHAIALNFGSKPWQKTWQNFVIDAVRIPHAGWPARADVENFVFRVTFSNGDSVMHMGDADPDDQHYIPYMSHWAKTRVDVNFPPYWFFMSAEGRDILFEILNADKHIGIHVPKKVPRQLNKQTKDYFSIPKSTHFIK